MIKIFRYECQRLLWNKFFFGLLLVLLFYGWQVLNQGTLFGVAHTAPFSPWSFGDYLSRMTPLLWLGTLFFLTFFTSGPVRRCAVLTGATPVSEQAYALARCAAALAGTALLAASSVMEAAAFYSWYFGWHAWGSLLFPAMVTLLPPLALALASGWLLGEIRPWLLYAWMAAPFVCRALPLPAALGMWNGSFFTQYPLTCTALDPAFALPAPVAAAQGAVLVLAVGLLLCGPRLRARNGAARPR